MLPLALALLLTGPAHAERVRLDAPRDALAVAESLLQEHRGLFIGETHVETDAGYRFLLENFPRFKARGVGLLGIEMINAVNQPEVDAYYADPVNADGPLKDVLLRRWGGDRPYRFDLVERARGLGIATEAIDHRPNQERLEPIEINAKWADSVDAAAKKLGRVKFVVYGGFLHGLPGSDRVPALLHIPAIIPADPNDFRDEVYSFDGGYKVVAVDGDVYSAVESMTFADAARREARASQGALKTAWEEAARRIDAFEQGERVASVRRLGAVHEEILDLKDEAWERAFFEKLFAAMDDAAR